MTEKAGATAHKQQSPGAGAAKTAKKAARKPTTKGARASSNGAAVGTLPVLREEDPWTAKELAEVRAELEAERDRMQAEVDEAEQDLVELMRDSGEGSGDDQADAGAATWEREHELSLANNARGLLEQTKHALGRIEAGGYGVCESCGSAIGKMRLQAFPRATLCMPCKQRQERR